MSIILPDSVTAGVANHGLKHITKHLVAALTAAPTCWQILRDIFNMNGNVNLIPSHAKPLMKKGGKL
jgi:hypothetical protein